MVSKKYLAKGYNMKNNSIFILLLLNFLGCGISNISKLTLEKCNNNLLTNEEIIENIRTYPWDSSFVACALSIDVNFYKYINKSYIESWMIEKAISNDYPQAINDANIYLLKLLLERNGLLIQYVDDVELRNNTILLLIATLQNKGVLNFISNERRTSYDFVTQQTTRYSSKREIIELIYNDLINFKLDSTKLKNMDKYTYDSEDAAYIVVKHDGLLLKYFSEKIRDNEKVVLVAVKNNGLALQFCTKKEPILRDVLIGHYYGTPMYNQRIEGYKKAPNDCARNKRIILEAIKNNQKAIAFVDESLWSDLGSDILKDRNGGREFIMELNKINKSFLEYIPEKDRNGIRIYIEGIEKESTR